MNKQDLLLPEEEMKEAYTSRIQDAFKFRNLANAASLHTAKVIRDELNRIDKNCVDTKQVDDKFQWFLHELETLIKEMGSEK